MLPLAALSALLIVIAAPEASLSAAKGLVELVAAHPVACSALILAAAGVALSPYLLLVAAALALAWGVPKLPAPLRPQLPAPIAEARATLRAAAAAGAPALEAAKEKLRLDSLVEGEAATVATAAAEEARRSLEKIKQVVELPARSTVAAVSRVAGRAKAAASAAKAAGAQAIGEVGRCRRSETTAAKRAACVRQQEAELVGEKRGGE